MNLERNFKMLIFSFDKYPFFNSDMFFEKKIQDWVSFEMKSYDLDHVHIANSYDNFTPSLLTEYDYSAYAHLDYIVVVPANALFLNKNDVIAALEKFKLMDIDIARIGNCYISKTDYLLNVEKIYSPKKLDYENENFNIVNSEKELLSVSKSLKNKVLSWHRKKGVKIQYQDFESIIIGSNVKIKSGTKISAGTSIKGETYIGKNVIIGRGVSILDSYVLDNCIVKTSTINNSIVKENVKIGYNCFIYNKSVVQANSKLLGHITVNRGKIEEGSKISPFRYIGQREV